MKICWEVTICSVSLPRGILVFSSLSWIPLCGSICTPVPNWIMSENVNTFEFTCFVDLVKANMILLMFFLSEDAAVL